MTDKFQEHLDICTEALPQFLSLSHYHTTLNVIPLLVKAILTSSIKPNLDLPRTSCPLAYVINTLLAISHPTLHADSSYCSGSICTTSFLTLSTRAAPAKLLKHIHFFLSRWKKYVSYVANVLF